MATTNPFVITTALDLTGIKKDLGLLRTELKTFKAEGISKNIVDPKAKAEVKQLRGELGKTAQAYKKVEDAANKAEGPIKGVGKEAKKTNNMLGDVARRVFVWGTAASAIFGTIQAMKELYEMTIKVNTAMAEIQKVVPALTNLSSIKKGAFDLSIEFGVDPLEVLRLLKRFSQSGLNAAEAMKATQVALVGMNATGVETEQMFNAIIAANRLFGISFENSAKVIDKVMKVQATFAIDPGDLIDAIKAVGPAITVLNGNIDDLFSNVAAMGEASRISGKEAGNSLKRVLSRLVSPEGIAALQRIGVKVLETADKFRPLNVVLGELNEALKTVSAVEKQRISLVLAQVRQYPKLVALLDNYVHQQEALKISQEASGEATKANAIIMSTYAKQSTVASNQIKALAENVFASDAPMGSFAGTLTAIKVGFGEMAEKVNGSALPSIVQWVTLLTMAAGIMTTFVRVTNAAGKSILMLAGAEKAGVTSMMAFRAISWKAIGTWLSGLSVLGKVALGFTVLAAAVTGAAYFMGAFAEKDKRRQRILKASQRAMDDYIKSLAKQESFSKDVGISGVARYEKLKQAILGVKTEGEDVGSVYKNVKDVFGGLFFDIKGADLASEQITEIKNRLEELQSTIVSVNAAPFIAEVDKMAKEIKPKFEEIATLFESGFAQVKAPISGYFNTLGGAMYTIDVTGITKLEDVLEQITNLDFGKKLQTKQIKEVSVEITKYIINIQKLDTQLRKVGDNVDMKNNLGIVRADTVNEAAKSLLKLIDVEKLLGEAAKTAGVSIKEGTGQGKIVNEVTQQAIEILTKRAKAIGLNTTQTEKLVKAVRGLLKTFEQANKVAGVIATSFNMAAFLSGIKASTAAIASSFNVQFESIKRVADISSKLGLTYDINRASISSVNSAIKELDKTLVNNQVKINNLQLETKGVTALLDSFKAKDLIERDPNAETKFTKRLGAIRINLATLNAVQKKNLEQYDSMIAKFIEGKKKLQDLLDIEKKRVAVLKGQKDLRISLLQQVIKLNDASLSGNSIKLSQANEKVYREILNVEIAAAKYMEHRGKITKQQLDNKITELNITYNIGKANRDVEERLSRVNKLYKDMHSDMDAVGESFASMVGDQSAFFDDLESRGSLLQMFKRTFENVGAVMAEADARVIGEAIAKQSEFLFSSAKTEIEKTEKDVKDIVKNRELGIGIRDLMKEGGDYTAQKILDSLMVGAGAMQEVINSLAGIVSASIKQLATEMESKTGLFTKSSKRQFVPEGKYSQEINRASGITGLDPDLIQAVIKAESGGNPNALSEKGAKGLMQIMDTTAKEMQVKNAYDPAENILAGSKQLDELIKEFGSIRLALAAYNAGPGAINKYGGMPPFKETQEYVDRVLKYYDEAKNKKTATFPPINSAKDMITKLYSMPPIRITSTELEALKIKADEQLLATQEQTNEMKGKKSTKSLFSSSGDGTGSGSEDETGSGSEDETGKEKKQILKDALFRRLSGMAGQAAGFALAKNQNRDVSGVLTGQTLGMTIGSVVPGIGTIAGGLVGSLLGGLFGRKKDKPDEQLNQLKQISNNTAAMVDKLSPNIFNAPAGFVLPRGQGQGNTVNVTNHITVTDGNTNGIVDTLAAQLNDLYQRSPNAQSSLG